MRSLQQSGFIEPLRNYIKSGKPYFGICIGMQVLFASSSESEGLEGLGVVPYGITKFDATDAHGTRDGRAKAVPHMGWNDTWPAWGGDRLDEDYYFVHSYAALLPAEAYDETVAEYAHSLTRYGSQTFISSVRFGNVYGTQFHPEKSGAAGLELLRRWLENTTIKERGDKWQAVHPVAARRKGTGLTNRIVACLDVRSNDQGDLVVTKGDQYDVREKSDGGVRNLGKPVELAQKYYDQGADEVCFLNITSFRSSALLDQPMLEVVRAAAETVFVPLTIGGGIKDTVDPDGTERSAFEVAGAYFRSGADKVSIGSDAVYAVEELLEREARGEGKTGKTAIETISAGYGAQAVVVSIDPKRVYLDTSNSDWLEKVDPKHRPCIITGETSTTRTKEQEKGKAWWYQCTVQGGRAVRDLDVIQLAQGVERLGAGELLLNSVDRDGSGLGFDLDLVRLVKEAVGIPVVTSSGAGAVGDFEEVFNKTGTEAALAAGIFHRGEVAISDVKQGLSAKGMSVRT
jgi:glutamine amidotransferase/cyclase